jgi:hypothetical protein
MMATLTTVGGALAGVLSGVAEHFSLSRETPVASARRAGDVQGR